MSKVFYVLTLKFFSCNWECFAGRVLLTCACYKVTQKSSKCPTRIEARKGQKDKHYPVKRDNLEENRAAYEYVCVKGRMCVEIKAHTVNEEQRWKNEEIRAAK